MKPTEGASTIPRSAPRRSRVGVSLGYAWTNLVFAGGIDVSLERRAVVATYERRIGGAWTVQVGAGGILWGSLGVSGARYSFGPGWSASVATSYRLFDGRGRMPFLLLGGSLAVANATTREEKPGSAEVPYWAGDVRLSALVGKTVFDVLSPYVAARAFGGPIFWRVAGEDVTGTDRYHFQLGAGLSVSLPVGLDVFAELIPLGERAVSTGAGFSF